MSILNPVFSTFTLTQGVPFEVYSCPVSKSHAIIDVSFFKDLVDSDSMIMIALTTKTDAAQLNSVDYFIDDIELIGGVNSAELNKVVVGAGERLYINVLTGPDINARLSGIEETNPNVLNAGRLAAMSIPGTSDTVIFDNSLAGTSYTSCSITVYNSSELDSAEVEAWITDQATPGAVDKVMRINIPTTDTTIVENVMLKPGEKIIFKSSQPNCEIFVNGVVVGSL